MAAPAPISDITIDLLCSGSDFVRTHGKATLRVETVDGPNEPEERFVMTGPSGTHSLLVVATNAARLNAHWQVFATDARNQGDPQ